MLTRALISLTLPAITMTSAVPVVIVGETWSLVGMSFVPVMICAAVWSPRIAMASNVISVHAIASASWWPLSPTVVYISATKIRADGGSPTSRVTVLLVSLRFPSTLV